MWTTTDKYWSILLSAFTLTALALSACQSSTPAVAPASTALPTARSGVATPVNPPTRPAASTSTAVTTVADFDQQFIDMMVPHHEGAIEIGKLAQLRGERAEIRDMAADILRTQDAEISQMRQWRQQWYGSSATPPMNKMPMLSAGGISGSDHTMDMAADVEQLRNATGSFDVAFIDAMIPHHTTAIDASRVALQQSKRPELQSLASAIIEAQQREIGQMRAWKLAWGTGAPGAFGAAATPGTGQMPGMSMPTPAGREVPGEDMNH